MAEENRNEAEKKKQEKALKELMEIIRSLDEERAKEITRLLKEEQKAEQLKHQLQRQENREKSESRKKKDARTHILCTKAGHVECLFPKIKDAGKAEFFQFMDGLLEIPGVKEYGENFVYRPIDEKEAEE